MKFSATQRAYHQRVLQEVSQMLRLCGKQKENIQPPTREDHEWAARKLQQLVKV